MGEIEPDSAAAMEKKLAAAHKAFRAWRQLALTERISRVESCLTYFEDHGGDIATEISRQMGKPIRESKAEVQTMLERARITLGLAEHALRPRSLPEKPGYIRRVEHLPLGVVLSIAAWNYPLLIPINVIIPGLLAGNAILLKHSPLTWLTGRRFTEAFAGLGIDGLVNDVVITHPMAAQLMVDRRVAHVTFTGSVRGGREVYQTVAGSRFIDVGLELGGKDAAYVAADAKMRLTTGKIVEGALYNAGQSCCSIERVYVHESRYEDFLGRVEQLIDGYHVGDPLENRTTLGPMARRASLAFLEDQVMDATDSGAELVVGGEIFGSFFQPTLLSDVPQDARIMQEETFGPILAVASVDSDEQAIELMNDCDFGLTASVWTKDIERAEYFARQLDVGTVFQNRCDYLDPELPWTGVRDSGKGSTLAESGFFHLTRRKSIHFRTLVKAS